MSGSAFSPSSASAETKAETVQLFNFQQPLSSLKIPLEELWKVSLTEHTFWLQNTIQLDADRNLLEHGIEGEGNVAIKLHLKMRDNVEVINIVDISNSAAEYTAVRETAVGGGENMQWVESKEFNLKRALRNMPANLEEWSIEDVNFWIRWAVNEFQLEHVNFEAWQMTGRDVQTMTADAFKELIPSDPCGQFWTHLQVLQKFGRVAVRSSVKNDGKEASSSATNMILCKFMLNLLTDKQSKSIIRWLNDEGEFEIVQPKVVASRWGAFEQKTEMTFDRMSRELKRQTAIISRSDGAKHIYKFNFDVREVLGYTPTELDTFVNEP